MASTSSVSGLSSGLDWRKVIDQLKQLEYQKLNLVKQQKNNHQEKINAWQSINKKLLALKTKAESLRSSKGFNLYTTSLSSNTEKDADQLLSVSTTEEASPGSYQIIVHQLASAQKFSSRGFSSQTSSLDLSGTLLIGERTVNVSSTDTLLSIRDKINAANTGTDPSGASATIVQYGSEEYRLILTSDREGSQGIRLQNGGSEDLLGAIGFSEIQAGADALLSVDGFPVSSSSNAVKEVIGGVTLNLKKADLNTIVTVTVKRDYAGVKDKIKELTHAFNEVMDAIHAQFSYDQEKQKAGGPLFGDSALRSIRSSLSQMVLNRISGTQEAFSTLGLIGINLDLQGKLKIDDKKLQGYLETNFEDVKKLFSVSWSSTNGDLNYVYHTTQTQPGTYSVQITGINPVEGYFVETGDATGNGEYLRGISGNAKGLIVRYSGTATGSIGSLTLNFGMAELLSRSLTQMTDSLNGTIANKIDGIGNTIRNMEGDLLKMEERFNRRMAELERQFVAMESALSKLQSQSGWLTSQINTIHRGWW